LLDQRGTGGDFQHLRGVAELWEIENRCRPA
jgi:hypothetical protein